MEHGYFVTAAVQVDEIERHARRMAASTGEAQWVHHHPQGYLCTDRCHRVEPPEPDHQLVHA